MARPRTAKHPEPTPPAHAEPPPSATNDQPTTSISKAEAVRQALAQGLDGLDDIAAFLKSQHGIEMPRPQISAYKAQIKRKSEGGESRPRTQSAHMPMTGIPSGFGADVKTVKTLIETAGGIEQLKDLAGTIGSLVQKYGADGLSELIDAFGE